MMEPAGTKLPEEVIDHSRCGAYSTGWLNGTHPTEVGTTVGASVCFHSYKSPEETCKYSTPIEIRNCGDYFLYYLRDTPECSLKYCSV